MGMSGEVEDLKRQFAMIVADARALAESLDEDAFNRQPAPGSWSPAQCIEHLNITARKMLPGLKGAAEAIRQRGTPASAPTRHGWLVGWLIRGMEPPPKRRFKTGAAFVPPSRLSRTQVMNDFIALHQELGRILDGLSGLDLNGAKLQSPFFKLLRYKAGSAFALHAAHDRRHLWQAREAGRRVGGGH
ncbi:MAG TPA: DinB family protein [Gemmatimonadales bacterium]|nr:DinB family protein [Gemmatimonadales bacterium]